MKNPVSNVIFVQIEKLEANDYNPNFVAEKEIELLHLSILKDGWTQPIVTYYDDKRDKYIIVDGFHRWAVAKRYKDISERNGGKVPIVVIDKTLKERMASTVRHNRARGKHTITGMSNLVLELLKEGMSDEEICKEIGLEPEELNRLKYVTGYAKLYENREYSKAFETRKMINERLKTIK